MDLHLTYYIQWLTGAMNMRLEDAVEKASKKLERQTGKGLTEREKWDLIGSFRRINPYSIRRT